jgi:amidase
VSELCWLSATELSGRIARREVSAVEVALAHLAQIERVNGEVNAVVSLVPEAALARARDVDATLARGEPAGVLAGLPVAHKDLLLTKGIRTTFGSPIYRDFVPDVDALIVQRLKAAGAITVGKTNTPEFGAGSQTFNPVFGDTRNPWDLRKTCGGSSGGAAVALACGMLPIADGSDLGGSLRNPASFCNVVGFRPSAGRVPSWPDYAPWYSLSVLGPMARTVQDVALMLSAIAGFDRRAPLSIHDAPERFRAPLERDFKGVRVAWAGAMGLPFDGRVMQAAQAALPHFEALGCVVDAAQPNLDGADQVFQTLRAWRFELNYGELLAEHRAQMKDTVIWNTEYGQRLSGPEVGRAERLRGEIFQRMGEFMADYEFLLLPVCQVPPFDIEQRYIMEIDGTPMATYIDWMKSCYHITVTGHPAISVPCGFTSDGLPIGLQIVGRFHDDFGVLQLAHAFEQANPIGRRRPPLAA